MELDGEGLLHRIVDLISTTIRLCSWEERRELQPALSVFTQCMTRSAFLDSDTAREVEAQIEWIHLYKSQRDQYPAYRAPLGNDLVPVAEDVDCLWPRFAHEVLEGAWAVADMLSVHPPVFWSEVKRKRRGSCTSESHLVDFELALESIEPRGDTSEEEMDADAIEYSYAYF
ncbi:hypothetical protein VCV18_012594 [Metarhizium anisopliae]